MHAEIRCPGNVAGARPRIVAAALLVIPVRINQAGPYDFIVDTGSQLNVIDPSLAAELHLKAQGTVGVFEVASYRQASVGMLDSIEAGSQVVRKPFVVVLDLGQIQAADRRIRGVLGEDFLAHFDVFIDYSHRLLCLDDSNVIQLVLRGERIPLVRPAGPEGEVAFAERLVISVNLYDTGTRPILLQLDSGSDGPMLYAGLDEPLLKRAKLNGEPVDPARQAFAPLPPQDMRVGNRTVRKVPFVTPVSAAQNLPDRREDGLLPTVLFQRVYICHADHYVIFDPK
jgi:hypothetical protein